MPSPPHVFEVDSRTLRYASFARGSDGWEIAATIEAALPDETFQVGPLGGPLRAREAFVEAMETVLGQLGEVPAEASLVLPDRWLRLLFTEVEEELGPAPGDDILRFKLKKLVPFRVDDLRLGATVVPAFPGQPGARLLFAFAIEQLVRDLETCFEARGVQFGQVASRSLYLVSLLREGPDRGLLLVNLEDDGYALCYIAGGVPYVVRYRAASVDPGDPGQAAQVAQDLRILIGFLEQHLPGRGIEAALVCGAPGSAAPWIELLRSRFDIAASALEAKDLPVATPAPSVHWHQVAPLVAAATREVA